MPWYNLLMPIIKSAIKKAKVDKRRTEQNLLAKGQLKSSIKAVRSNPTQATLSELYSALDKAVKTHVIVKGHAARLKSRIAKIVKK